MTYLYETVPVNKGDQVKQYEIKQSAEEAPLTVHPETGEPIRRIILGGWGLVNAKPIRGLSSPGDCGCGPNGCC